MGIENLIANSIQPSGIMTPFQLQAGQDELNQNKLMNEARRRAMAEQDRQRAQEGLINRLYSENYNNPEGFKRAAAQAGIGSVIPEYENQQREVQKEQRLQEAAGLEKIIKTSEVIASRLRGARPENWEQTVAGIEQEIGKPIPKLHFAYDPQKVDAVIQEGLSNTDAIKLKLDEYRQTFEQEKFGYQKQKDDRQMALQEKTANNQQQWNQANFDQRERSIEATRINKPAVVTSEDERKAAGWYSQADNAYKNLQNIIEKYPASQSPGALETFLPDKLKGAARDTGRQMSEQAYLQLSDALLRAATGSGQNEGEARRKIEEIAPTIWDSDEVKKQKMDSIPTYIESLKQRAGRALPEQQKPSAGPGKTIVRTGRTKDGQKVVKYSDGSIEIAQ